MKKQLIIAVSVFTVGFAVGYGITWILVSGGQSDSDARAEVRSGLDKQKPQAASSAPGKAATGPETNTAKSNSDAKDPGAQATPAGGAPSKADPGEEAIGSAPVIKKQATPTPVATEKPNTKKADEAGNPDAAEAAPPKTWWDRCVGKVCGVNWGQVRGGISIRKGSISHGSRVDWKLRFGNAPRLDTVKTSRKTLRVHAVGLGLDGEPTCAEVEYRRGGNRVRGILALKLGNKRIKFVPGSE